MEQILHVVFIGESQLLGSFTSIGQRVHGTTQTLNNYQNNFIDIAGLCWHKASCDLTIHFIGHYLAHWQHPAKPKISESIVCQSILDSTPIITPLLDIRCTCRPGIHILFKHIAKNLQAINRSILPSAEQPLLPFGMVS